MDCEDLGTNMYVLLTSFVLSCAFVTSSYLSRCECTRTGRPRAAIIRTWYATTSLPSVPPPVVHGIHDLTPYQVFGIARTTPLLYHVQQAGGAVVSSSYLASVCSLCGWCGDGRLFFYGTLYCSSDDVVLSGFGPSIRPSLNGPSDFPST
jgi:hypothetical protein